MKIAVKRSLIGAGVIVVLWLYGPLLLALAVKAESSILCKRNPSHTALCQILLLQNACYDLQLDMKRYPSQERGLAELIERPPDEAGGAKWDGPYLSPPRLPLDPWGHGYKYRAPGTHVVERFDLYSCGADGISQTEGDDPDDINNWTDRQVAQQSTWWSRNGFSVIRLVGPLLLIPVIVIWVRRESHKEDKSAAQTQR